MVGLPPFDRGLENKFIAETAIASTVSWSAGTAPSGSAGLYYMSQKLGKIVVLQMRLEYSVAGSTVTGVDIDLPSGVPLPQDMTGVANGEIITCGSAIFSTNMTSNTSQGRCILIKESGSATGYRVRSFATSGSFIGAVVNITYFTSE